MHLQKSEKQDAILTTVCVISSCRTMFLESCCGIASKPVSKVSVQSGFCGGPSNETGDPAVI